MAQDNNSSGQEASISCDQIGQKLDRKDTILKGNKDVSNRRKCPECDGRISKESSKSKSRVWKKVMWFTRKSKAAKNDVCQCQTEERLEESHSNSWSFTRSASRKFRISSRKRQCKSESSRKSFQCRGKVDKPCSAKECSQPSTRAGSVCSSETSSPTATGSFCDFTASSHSGGRGSKTNKNTMVLTEIARAINPPVKNDVPPLRDYIHHPPKRLSKSSSSLSHVSQCFRSPLPINVRRTKSFPGSPINISPSKRRFISTPNKVFASFSPPLKQKCYGLRRTATFCGELNLEFPKACIRKSKSVNTELMRLEKATSSGEIQDQSGNIVGIVHFYKSPKKICARRISNTRNEVKNCDMCQEDEFLCNSDQISSNTLPDDRDLPQGKESVECCTQKVQNYMENNYGAENVNKIFLPECDVLNGRESVAHRLTFKETETVSFEKSVVCFDMDKSTVCQDNGDVFCVSNDEPVQDTVFNLVEGKDNIYGSKDTTCVSSGSIATALSSSSTNQKASNNFRPKDDTLIVTRNISLPSSHSETVAGKCLEAGTKQPSDSETFCLTQSGIEAARDFACGVKFGTIPCASSEIPKQNPGCNVAVENVKKLPKINDPSLKPNLMKHGSSCGTLLSKAASLNISKLETVSEVVELPCHHDDALSGDHYHGKHVFKTPPSASVTSQTCCGRFDIPYCNSGQVLENRDKSLTKQLCMTSVPCKCTEVSEECLVKNNQTALNANIKCSDETAKSLRNCCVRDDQFDLAPKYEMYVDVEKSEDVLYKDNAYEDTCSCNEMDMEQFESLTASDNGDLTHETKLIHSCNTDSFADPVNDLTSEVINSSSNSIKLAGEQECVCKESQTDCCCPDNFGNVAKLVVSREIFQGCDRSNVSAKPETLESTRTSDYVSSFEESFCRQNDARNDGNRFVSEEEFQRGVSSSTITNSETLESSTTSEYTSMFDTSLPPKQGIRNDATAIVFNEDSQIVDRCSVTSSFPETLESSTTSEYASMCNEIVSRKRDVQKGMQTVKSKEDCQRCIHSNVNTRPDNLESSRISEYESMLSECHAKERDVPIHTWKNSESSDIKSDEIGLPVPGETFKMRTELMLSWFEEFNDEQRNIILKKILNRCDLPQMHLLSVAMENNLHKTCPPNCQDMLVWLPYTVTLKILMYLDPVSLCRCNQVNRAWNELTDNPLLWQHLTGNPDYQLSEASNKRQYQKFTQANGEIDWKKVFAERFLLQRNWLNGKYKLRTFEGHNQGIACVQFDDTRIVSGSSDKTIKLWDISNTPSELMLTLEGHSGTVRCLDLNGNRLVSGSTDRTIKVWDLSFASYWAGASCKVTMVGHLHTVRCLQADEKKLVSGSYDKTVKVWDLKTGSCQLTLRGHTAAVLCVQFDDQKIVSGSYDKKIKVWDLTEGTCLMTLDGHQDAVTCLNLTHDGMKIITGSLDYSLKFWDLSTGKCYGTLDWIRSEGHTAVVRCLQVDSWRIVSGGDDKTLKVWELATGQRLLTLRYHSDGVTCMQFNDFAIVSGSYDRTVKLWDFTPKHPYLEALT